VDKADVVRKKKRIGILCGTSISIILAGTLWPYNIFPPNRVSWLVDAKGIEFKRDGVVISDKPLMAKSSDASQPCSLELLLRPAGMQFKKTILSFYVRNSREQFRLNQAGKALGISGKFVDPRREPKILELVVHDIFVQGEPVLITITSSSQGTIIYKNGRQAQAFSQVRISLKDVSGQIVLGTSPVYYNPWEGDVHGLALYATELTQEEVLRDYVNWTSAGEPNFSDLNGVIAYYAFVEGMGRKVHNAVIAGPDLRIPRIFRVPYKPILETPIQEFKWSESYGRSVLVNIAMFVPVGYLLCAYWRLGQSPRRPVLRAILGAGLLSLIIEVLQAYIPFRFSGMTDILTNTLGASLGAALMQAGWFARGVKDN